MASSSSSDALVEIVADARRYLELYRAAVTGDWSTAEMIFERDGEALVRTAISPSSETALMVAIRSRRRQRNEFVKELVARMSPADLALTDSSGSTALHVAAAAGNLEAAELLVKENASLPNLWNSSMTSLPLHRAAECGQDKMFVFLLDKTRDDLYPNPFEGDVGVKLLNQLIANELFGAALSLVRRYPELARSRSLHEPYPLEKIAMKPSVFQSVRRISLFQRLIYRNSTKFGEFLFKLFKTVVQKLPKFPNRTVQKLPKFPNQTGRKLPKFLDRIVQELSKLSDRTESAWMKYILMPGFVTLRYIEKLVIPYAYWSSDEQLVSFIHDFHSIQRKTIKHEQALELVRHLCTKASNLDHTEASVAFGSALLTAASAGTHEVVEEILASFPGAVFTKNELNQNLFDIAIVNRHVNVFNLIYQVDEELRRGFLSAQDKNMNNGLHLVGYLKNEQKLNLRTYAAGAALQMQRELQWFKEVERFLLPQDKEQRNSEGKTPAMVFAEKHKDLVEEGQKWMRGTAKSCTIVAALVATVVFTGATEVPGGANKDGNPNFFGRWAFKVFAASDALALYASTASVLVFLTILTSRYAADDFLYALPSALIAGFATMFFSILSMIVAFGSTLYLMFNGRLWTLAPMCAISLYLILLAWNQFRLHLELMRSTYGFSIFYKQSKRILL